MKLQFRVHKKAQKDSVFTKQLIAFERLYPSIKKSLKSHNATMENLVENLFALS
ncbi:MAG: hypothetical protein AB3N16_01615 [Flavobacteriaceae bacterium]